MPIGFVLWTMSDRPRTDEGRYAETVTPERVLGVFDRVEGPAITSSDVATALSCSTEAARQKLKLLHERGGVRRRKTGITVLWWRVDETGNDLEINDVNPDDPFFTRETYMSDAPADTSERIDDVLYGDPHE